MGVLVTTFAGNGRVSPVDVFENAQDMAAVSRSVVSPHLPS